MIYSHGPKPKRFFIVKCAPLMLFHFLLGLLVAADESPRTLCVFLWLAYNCCTYVFVSVPWHFKLSYRRVLRR